MLATRAKAAREDIVFAPDSWIRLSLVFVFRNARGDVSNPLKRVEDALAKALEFNDARVAELHIYRQVGEPGIWAEVAEMDDHDPELPRWMEAAWMLRAG